MSKSPLVTVILPTYNSEDTIEKAVYSILYQSYLNIELIIIDDLSTDRTLDILSTVSDNRVRVLQMQKNSGVYNCRNVGLSVALGDYLTFQDADDISDPFRIQRSVEALADENIVMSYGQYIRYTSSYEIVKRDNFNCMVTMMIKRFVLDDIGYLDTVQAAGDSEYFWRIHAHYSHERIAKLYGFMYYALDSQGLTKQFAFSSPVRLAYVEDFKAWHENSDLYMPLNEASRPFNISNTQILTEKNVTGFYSLELDFKEPETTPRYSREDYLIEVNAINRAWQDYITYLRRSLWYKINKQFVSLINFLRFKLGN